MYTEGLGFETLGGFTDHDGFDGVMLGHPDAGYHLEFTRESGAAPLPPPSPEQLLVFYVPDRAAWEAACARMLAAGFVAVTAYNSYWELRGATFADVDGYRVVLQNSAWPPSAAPG